MVELVMNKGFSAPARIALALAAASLPLAACHRTPAEAPLAGARIGGPFVLTDQDGRRYSSAALAGRYPILYFGYTYCPDVCPTDMQVVAQGLKLFAGHDPARGARVQPIFVTVDPARDTPAVLKRFVANFPPLIGLTGSAAEIAAVAKEYAVIYKAQPPAPGASGYLVDHSRTAILYGPDLKPIALLPQDESPEAVAKALDTWVQ